MSEMNRNEKTEYSTQFVNAVREMLAVIDSHDIDTFDCDRSGRKYCDCLKMARKKVQDFMPE